MDLAVIVVSANDARWLTPCLQSVYAHAGGLDLEVIVVDNASSDGTAELVRERFPVARLVQAANHGFAAGCNRGLEVSRARWALLLNPDTEILHGSLAELIATLDTQPTVGVAGVRQLGSDDELLPTIRRFPSALRALGEALAYERWPRRPAWAGERVLDRAAYATARDCDWVVGSFLLARREALTAAGLLDERFFLYCEEIDLCLRIASAGWRVRYLPALTIRHHAGKGGVRPRLLAQEAFARGQYARKHLRAGQRRVFIGALALRHLLRLPLRRGARRALATLAGRDGPPFMAPPPTALTRGAALVSPVRRTAPVSQVPSAAARFCEEGLVRDGAR